MKVKITYDVQFKAASGKWLSTETCNDLAGALRSFSFLTTNDQPTPWRVVRIEHTEHLDVIQEFKPSSPPVEPTTPAIVVPSWVTFPDEENHYIPNDGEEVIVKLHYGTVCLATYHMAPATGGCHWKTVDGKEIMDQAVDYWMRIPPTTILE